MQPDSDSRDAIFFIIITCSGKNKVLKTYLNFPGFFNHPLGIISFHKYGTPGQGKGGTRGLYDFHDLEIDVLGNS